MTQRAGFWPTVAGMAGAGAGFVAGMDVDLSTTVIVTGNHVTLETPCPPKPNLPSPQP
jgi:hypothetical protein